METNFIPVHLGWDRIKEYIPLLQEVVEKYPETVVFRPTTVAPSTLVARLRDCMASCLRYNWPVPGLERLPAIRQDLEVHLADGLVVVSSRKAKNRNQPTVPPATSMSERILAPEVTSLDVLRALALLLSRRVLETPVRFQWSQHSDIEQISRDFDVAIQRDEHGYRMF